jgi:hypothetical protein
MIQCRGLGPGEGSCKQCSKASVESTAVVGCVWEYNDCDLDKRTRSQLSDCGEDRTPDDLKRIKKAEVAADDAKFTFLCPYFLRDSEKWRSVHSCSGDGWNKLHRLK